MITVEVVGERELVARLDALPDKLRQALYQKVTALALQLEAKVKGKLSNDVLQVRTGALRRSIFSRVDQTATGVTGIVGSSGDVKYAGIQEYGGRTRAHVIEAVNGKALAFSVGGKQVFARRINHPGSNIPARSYLRSSLADMRDEITAGITDAVTAALKP